MNICLCDDDRFFCQKLRNMLTQYSYCKSRNFNFIEYHSIDELVENTKPFDVLFLDIRFDGSDRGIDAAQLLRSKGIDSFIIFMTSLSEYSMEGYKAEAFRYLTKPLSESQLHEAMDTIIRKLHRASTKERRISFQSYEGLSVIKVNNILAIASDAALRQRRIILFDGAVETRESLKDIFEKLPKGQFAYTKQNWVVNMDYIRAVDGTTVHMINNLQIPFGRKIKEDFLIAFEKFVGEEA